MDNKKRKIVTINQSEFDIDQLENIKKKAFMKLQKTRNDIIKLENIKEELIEVIHGCNWRIRVLKYF